MSESVCIIHGEQDAAHFPARVNGEGTIGELKKLIKAEKSNRFKDIDADSLKLWKWNQPGDANRVKVVELELGNVLNPMGEICEKRSSSTKMHPYKSSGSRAW